MRLADAPHLAASRDRIFVTLDNPDIPARRIVGRESLNKPSDTEMDAIVALDAGSGLARPAVTVAGPPTSRRRKAAAAT